MSATETLHQSCHDDWTAATTHAFTDALAAGTLDRERMAGYLQQDYLFVEGFVRLMAAAISQGPTLADVVPAAQFLGLICGEENTYFLRSFNALEVPATEAQPAPETRAFQQLMEEARLSGSYANMLAVLVVAEWSYLDWATPHEERVEDLPFWLGEWITLHAGENFTGVVSYLRGQLDAVYPTLSASEQAEVTRLFTRAVELERGFFDAAWRGFAVAR